MSRLPLRGPRMFRRSRRIPRARADRSQSFPRKTFRCRGRTRLRERRPQAWSWVRQRRPAVVQQAPEMSPEIQRVSEERPVELRDAVLNALSGAGHRILINMLETAEWQVEGNELVIKIAGLGNRDRDVAGRGCETADDCHRQRGPGPSGEAAGGAGGRGSELRRGRHRAMAAAGAGRSRTPWCGA